MSDQQRETENAPLPECTEECQNQHRTESEDYGTAREEHQQSEENTLSNSQALQLVREHWPDVFRIARPRPLKIGIHNEMKQKSDLTINTIRKALKLYTQQDRYLLAIKSGSPRIGLDGKPSGRVKLGEAVNAEILLYKRHSAREDRNKRVFIGQLKLVSTNPAQKAEEKTEASSVSTPEQPHSTEPVANQNSICSD